jgi:hypothetical protein
MSNKRALLEIFEMYTSPSGMTSSKFVKIMKDSNLLDTSLSQTDIDLIFTKVKSMGQRNISFEEFKARLELFSLVKYSCHIISSASNCHDCNKEKCVYD